jgi:hypothetical protein
MILATTPPRASMPSESGVTSSRSRSFGGGELRRGSGLDGGAEGDDFVGIEFGVGLLAAGAEVEELVDERADGGDAGRAADQDDFVDLSGVMPASLRACLHGAAVRAMTGCDELLELRAGDFAGCSGRAVGQASMSSGGGFGGERDLGFDDGFAEGLDGFGIAGARSSRARRDVVEGDGDEQVVDVVAAEVGVAVGGDDFEDAVVELEDGDVEGAAAEVVDGDDAVFACRGRRRGRRRWAR